MGASPAASTGSPLLAQVERMSSGAGSSVKALLRATKLGNERATQHRRSRAAHEDPLYPTQSPAVHHYRTGAYLVAEGGDRFVGPSQLGVRLSNGPSGSFDLLYLVVQKLLSRLIINASFLLFPRKL